MTTERLEEIRLGSCPTCGGPAQFIDPAVPASEREGLTLHHAVRSGVEAETAFYVREVRLPNIDEDLGNGWRLSSLHVSRLEPGSWIAVATRHDANGEVVGVSAKTADGAGRAYLALHRDIEAQR